MLDLLHVPRFARGVDYAGVWAIEPTRGAALWAEARRTDLVRHVAEAGPPKLRSELLIEKGPKGESIGVVMLAGPLMKAVGSMEPGTSTVQARRDLRKAAADPEISAILLAIDSPGGTVAGTADLAADVLSAQKRKPVWAYVADLGASAAFWIGSQAERLVANDRTALVGSIGTLAVVYDLSAMAEKEGIKTLVFGTGPLKGAGAPGAAVTEEQQEYFRGMVEDAQRSFDHAVRSGRKITAGQLADAKTGGVFGATEALDRKLIDAIDSWDRTVSELAAEARRRSKASITRATSPVPVRSQTMSANATEAVAGAEATAASVSNTTINIGASAAEAVAEVRLAIAAEKTRVAGIENVCSVHPAIAAQAIAEGWSIEKAENAALKASLSNHVRSAGPGLISRSHGQDCTIDALQGAMILRAGGRLDHPSYQSVAGLSLNLPGWLRAGINADQRQRAMEFSHRYSSLSLIDLCREAVRLDGKDVPLGQDDLLRAAFSGGTLTNIFTTSVNVMLLASYMEAGDTTDVWTRTVDVADFKTQERPRLEKQAGLKKLPRGKEADHAEMSDKAESYKIARYAAQFVVDEQDIIDDSMNALQTKPTEFGMAARRVRPDLVYYILLSNPTLTATARELFNATDGNLDTTAGLADTTLKAAIAAMRLFQENGVNLNIEPTHLIVPPTLEFKARELLQSTTIVISQAGTTDASTVRGSANTLMGLLQPIAEARLENGVTDPDSGTAGSGSSSTWFLASSTVNTIEVAYRRGTGRAPQVRSFVLDKGKWGLGWDINLDIGAKAMDWRGLHKATS